MPGIVPRGTRLQEFTRFSALDLDRIERAVGEHYAEVYEKCRNTQEAVRIVADKIKMKLERFQLGMRIKLYTGEVEKGLKDIGLEYEITSIVIYRAPEHADRKALKIVFRNPFARQVEDTFWMSEPAPAKS